MSRSGYVDDCWDCDEDAQWRMIRYRGAVKSALRGHRGQAFLRELVEALDAMPVKELVAHDLKNECGVCAMGAVGLVRGLDMSSLDPDNAEGVSGVFDIATSMAREIAFENDECGHYKETPYQRWCRMRLWAQDQIKPTEAS